jgi:anti-sigma regulatory factor (Ser/Thr protein kinase)
MPYYHCPACGLTVHSVGGRFTRNLCPNCAAPLASEDRIQIEEHHAAAITRRFPPEDRSAAAARRELATLLWNLDSAEFDTVALLVTEMITNSVKHSGMRPGGSVRLDVALTESLVRVEVRDDGPGFVPASRDDESPLESHWGLHLMEELADRWHVDTDPHTVVWFELDRVPTARAPLS